MTSRRQHWRFFVSLAEEFGAFLDLHVDETLDRNVFTLPALAALVADGFSRPVTASHCVSLGVQNESTQRRVAEALAASASVSSLSRRRTSLCRAGTNRCRPPWWADRYLSAHRCGRRGGRGSGQRGRIRSTPWGAPDGVEVAALLVAAGHLTPAEALRLVTTGGRDALGLQPVEIAARVAGRSGRRARRRIGVRPSPTLRPTGSSCAAGRSWRGRGWNRT